MSLDQLLLFSGNANLPLARAVARELLINLGNVEVGEFPDGEWKIQFKVSVRKSPVFLFQPMISAASIIQLFLLIDAARRASAGSINVIIPYYGYARQDRKDTSRVPISAKVMATIIETLGAHRVLVLDPHSPQVQGFFEIPVDIVYARPEQLLRLQMFLKLRPKEFASNVVLDAPDAGAANMNQSYANRLGCDIAFFHKKRKSGGEIEHLALVGNVRGRIAVMIDDMVTTAGTLVSASEILQRKGA